MLRSTATTSGMNRNAVPDGSQQPQTEGEPDARSQKDRDDELCRIGNGCSRLLCHFRHPTEGRAMKWARVWPAFAKIDLDEFLAPVPAVTHATPGSRIENDDENMDRACLCGNRIPRELRQHPSVFFSEALSGRVLGRHSRDAKCWTTQCFWRAALPKNSAVSISLLVAQQRD